MSKVVEFPMKHLVSDKIGALVFGLSTTPSILLLVASLVGPFPITRVMVSVEDDRLIGSGSLVTRN